MELDNNSMRFCQRLLVLETAKLNLQNFVMTGYKIGGQQWKGVTVLGEATCSLSRMRKWSNDCLDSNACW
jgi:hypothetical protein